MNDPEYPVGDPGGGYYAKGLVVLGASAAVLLLFSWVFIQWDLDRIIAARFYSPDSGWFLREAQPWHWLYRYGTVPGVILTVLSLIGAVYAYLQVPARRWQRYFLLVLLSSLIGAGLLVNGILKPYWGRPRPNQIHEFKGKYPYYHVLQPGVPGRGKSFPSGHSTMGFIFVSLVYFRRKSVFIALAGGIGGLAYGSLISAARVVQGAHFVSDCFWSLGIIWLVATTLYYHVLKIPASEETPFRQPTRQRKRLVFVAGICLSVLILLLFATRRPFYETYEIHSGIPQTGISEIGIGLANGYHRAFVRYSRHDRLRVMVHASGFAWPNATETLEVVFARSSGTVYRALYRMRQRGYFSEVDHEIEVVVPEHLKGSLTVRFLSDTGGEVRP